MNWKVTEKQKILNKMHQKVKLNRQKKNKKKKWTTVAIHDWKKTQQTGEKRKLKIFDYSEQDTRKNRNWNKPGRTVSPFDSIGSSSDINRTASNFLNASEKVQKIKKTYQDRRMMLTLQKICLKHSSLSIKECSKILTQKSSQHTFRTKTWEI